MLITKTLPGFDPLPDAMPSGSTLAPEITLARSEGKIPSSSHFTGTIRLTKNVLKVKKLATAAQQDEACMRNVRMWSAVQRVHREECMWAKEVSKIRRRTREDSKLLVKCWLSRKVSEDHALLYWAAAPSVLRKSLFSSSAKKQDLIIWAWSVGIACRSLSTTQSC